MSLRTYADRQLIDDGRNSCLVGGSLSVDRAEGSVVCPPQVDPAPDAEAHRHVRHHRQAWSSLATFLAAEWLKAEYPALSVESVRRPCAGDARNALSSPLILRSLGPADG